MNKDAVQHERGPRKQKVKTPPNSLASLPSLPSLFPSGPPILSSTSSVCPVATASPSVLPPPQALIPTAQIVGSSTFGIGQTSLPQPPGNVPTPMFFHAAGSGLMHSLVSAEILNRPPPAWWTMRSGNSTYVPGSIMGDFESLSELGSRVLFTTMGWIRSVHAFGLLGGDDQMKLLEYTWCDLFLLSLTQWRGLGDGNSWKMDHLDQKDRANLTWLFRQVEDLRPDTTEYACLKAIVLLRSDIHGLQNQHLVQSLQDQCQFMLGEYARHGYPRHVTRFGRLLLVISCLRSISTESVHRLFFRGTPGDLSIHKLIEDLIKSL